MLLGHYVSLPLMNGKYINEFHKILRFQEHKNDLHLDRDMGSLPFDCFQHEYLIPIMLSQNLTIQRRHQ